MTEKPGRKKRGYMDIVSYIQSLPKETLYYCPNPGNGGDALIAHATFQLFRKCRLSYKVISGHDNLENKIVLYGGGGNLVDYYTYGAGFLAEHHRKVKKLIILPHTIHANPRLLAQFGDNVDVICRELNSYNYVLNTVTRANVMLMNDVAFHLNVHQTFEEKRRLTTLLKKARIYLTQYVKVERHLMQQALQQTFSNGKRTKRILNCFRTDREKTDMPLPYDNVDLSGLFKFRPFAHEKIAHLITLQILKYLYQFEQINTNRLHLCIAGILLDKQVNFFPNSYWKNEAVYDHSIRKKCANVKWIESECLVGNAVSPL